MQLKTLNICLQETRKRFKHNTMAVVELTAAKAVLTPDKLRIGTAAPPQEVWATSVLQERNLTHYDTLKKRLLEGTPVLDTTEADLFGLKNKANGIGKEIDTTNGKITRKKNTPEQQQFDEAQDGLKQSEIILKYESLPDADKNAFADKVAVILEARPEGAEVFRGLTPDQKRSYADRFIRTHKQDLRTLLRENTSALNADSRADTAGAAGEMYASEEDHAKAQIEYQIAKDESENAKINYDQLIEDQNEFNTPGGRATGVDNFGLEMAKLEHTERPRLSQMAPMAEKIKHYQGNIDRVKELYKNAKKGSKEAKEFSEQIENWQLLMAEEYVKYAPLEVTQQQLFALRKRKADLPKEIQNAQKEVNTKHIEEKQKESVLKKAADHMRVSREHKEMVDEFLASSSRDLWKRIINECADKDMDAMLQSLTSPEGRSKIMAGALTMLDRQLEAKWSKPHRRIHFDSIWGGKLGLQRFWSWQTEPLPDRKSISTSFSALLKDKTGTPTETVVKGMLGETWNSLTTTEQQQTVAAYVTKLVHRRVIQLKTHLRDGEIRAIRSGPFADELIKNGLVRIPDFRNESANIPGIDASNLDNPSAETLQHIKGRLDRDNLLTLLMLGLTPLSMMKQKEEHT